MSQRSTTPPPQGDQDVSGGLLATTILVTVIAIVLLALRFATRIWIVKRVGWDDWTILLAVLGHPIGMALVVVQISYGFGRPVYYLSDHQYREFMKYAYGEWLQTFATLMFTKISICLFLLRITVTKAFNRALQAAVVMLVVSNVVISMLWILQCTPHLDKAWDTEMPGMCFSKGQLERIIIAQAIISLISDFFLSIFPILILRKVQISFRSKVGLCSLMGLGIVTGSLAVARTVLNWQNLRSDLGVNPNWYIRTFEVTFGVVAATVPALRPGYKRFVEKARTRLITAGGTSNRPLQASPANVHWTPPKPSIQKQSLESDSSDGGIVLGGMEMLAGRVEPSIRQMEWAHYPHDDCGRERREDQALHVPGDMSVNRPGKFKRLDSEAKVGGGLGEEEVDYRL